MIREYDPYCIIATPEGLIESAPDHDHPECEQGKDMTFIPRCPGCQWQRLVDQLLTLPYTRLRGLTIVRGGSPSDN